MNYLGRYSSSLRPNGITGRDIEYITIGNVQIPKLRDYVVLDAPLEMHSGAPPSKSGRATKQRGKKVASKPPQHVGVKQNSPSAKLAKAAQQTTTTTALRHEFCPAGRGHNLDAQSKEMLANVVGMFEKGFIKFDTKKYKKAVGSNIEAAAMVCGIGKDAAYAIMQAVLAVPVGSTFSQPAARGRTPLTDEEKKKRVDALDPDLIPTIHSLVDAAQLKFHPVSVLWLVTQLKKQEEPIHRNYRGSCAG